MVQAGFSDHLGEMESRLVDQGLHGTLRELSRIP
jgi:hypothetical protein